MHYFKTKQRLFAESVAPLVSVHQRGVFLSSTAGAPQEEMGERIARAFIGLPSNDDVRPLMLSLVRSAASDPTIADILRDVLTKNILNDVSRLMTGPGKELKTTLLGSQLLGFVFARYVIKVEHLVHASSDTLVTYLAPRLQAHFEQATDEAVVYYTHDKEKSSN